MILGTVIARTLLLAATLGGALLYGQDLTPKEKELVDAALPTKATVKPKKPRRMLITNLSMRDGQRFKSTSFAIRPIHNYAFDQMGKRTGAYEPVFNDDTEMFRPEKIKEFDAICFLNSSGVLFEDPELRKSLLDYIARGGGIVGIHDAIATFVQWPKYDQWPAFGQMLGGTENGGHLWNNEPITIRIDDRKSPLTAMFHGQEFAVTDQSFQLQEPGNLRERLHVLTSIDVEKTPMKPTRKINPARAEDKDFPVTWIKSYGKGRVFYSALGHGAPVFSNPLLLQHFLAGIQYALGDLKANDAPTIKSAAKK
ncbi:MAG: ThuA domain-containing protein [Bryobacteraceae bacterium]